jgi:D-3-phosphoglycerate dehydrogenase
MPRPLILLTHSPAVRAVYYSERALAGLREAGEVRLNPHDRQLTLDELVAADVDIIVADRNTPGEPALFLRAQRLAAFVRGAVDIRNVSVPDASRAGVLVTRASAGFMAAVSELLIGYMVDLGRGVSRATGDYRAGRQPAVVIGRQLAGSTVGVIGYGQIGRYLCPILQALGSRVLVADPHVTSVAAGLEHVTLDRLLGEADFVVCLAIAVPETENLMNAAAFARMKPGAFFINGSRGNLVDEAALAAALDSGHIAGAAMDVGRASDQMPSPALAARRDVIATPHIGGLTPPAAEHQALESARQVAVIATGSAPEGAVNAEHAHRLQRLKGNAG